MEFRETSEPLVLEVLPEWGTGGKGHCAVALEPELWTVLLWPRLNPETYELEGLWFYLPAVW